MKRPAPRIMLMSVALIGIGSIAGAVIDRMSFPHVARLFNTCASSKQFLVEFRGSESDRPWLAYPPFAGPPKGPLEVTLDVDGVPIGTLGNAALRYFLCEGNHRAHMCYQGYDDKTVTHTITFAVSRPSLFLVQEGRGSDAEIANCDSEGQCNERVSFQFSPYEPDDPKVREYPPDERR